MAERARGHVHARERMQGASRTVEARVRARDGRRQDDEGEERAEARKAVLRNSCRKDTLIEARLVPRQDGDQERDRDDVERDDAPCHVAHRNRDALLRLLALAGGKADDLRALEVDEDDDHRQDNGPVAVRREAAAAEKDLCADITLIADEAEADEAGHDTEGCKSDDLDQRQPELTLAELIDMEQIENRHQESKEHSPPELADFWYKVIHDDASGNHLGWNVRNPGRPVGPAHTAGPGRRYVLPCIRDKRTRYRFFHRQLREAEHDAKHDDPAQEIGEDRGRARFFENIPGAEEVTTADDPAQRDQLQVAIL